MTYYVYQTTNTINGKKYIGLTKYSIESGYLGSGLLIKKAIRKYGKSNFTRVDLYSHLTLEEASDIEKQLISDRDAQNNDFYYNLRAGGRTGDEGPHHQSSIDQMSKKCKKAWTDKRDMYIESFKNRNNENIGKYDKSGLNNPMYGKSHTTKTRQRISTSKKGKQLNLTDEQRKARSEAIRKNPVMMGKKSETSKARMRWKALSKEFAKVPVVSEDMEMMHNFYGIKEKVEELSPEMLKEFLKFRFDFLNEELTEGYEAIENDNPEEIVDSLIDLVVVAVGTLDLYGVDFKRSWYEVLRANMTKEVGIKEGRPNPYNLPDLKKPEGWVGPDHSGNHGLMEKACKMKKTTGR